jgi:hypothetical protein
MPARYGQVSADRRHAELAHEEGQKLGRLVAHLRAVQPGVPRVLPHGRQVRVPGWASHLGDRRTGAWRRFVMVTGDGPRGRLVAIPVATSTVAVA